MTLPTHVFIEPSHERKRDFARWCLAQTPRLETASSTGTLVPNELFPSVPQEVLEGAYVDGYLYDGPAAPQPPSEAADAPVEASEAGTEDVPSDVATQVPVRTSRRARKANV